MVTVRRAGMFPRNLCVLLHSVVVIRVVGETEHVSSSKCVRVAADYTLSCYIQTSCCACNCSTLLRHVRVYLQEGIEYVSKSQDFMKISL